MAKFVNIDGLKPIKVFLSAYAEEPILVYKKEDIDRRTAADVAPVNHGEWMVIDDTGFYHYYLCNQCNKVVTLRTRYCPNCGARMDEEEQNE